MIRAKRALDLSINGSRSKDHDTHNKYLYNPKNFAPYPM